LIAAPVAVLVRLYGKRRGRVGERWLSSRPLRSRPNHQGYTGELFEIDAKCDACGEPNIGVEGGDWSGEDGVIRWFRTCGGCGVTKWWAAADCPPRIRLGSRSKGFSETCKRCGYALAGTPIRRDERSTDRLVLTQQCPECGRTEVVVPQAGAGAADLSERPRQPV
jgi:hypothetical protein